MPNTEQQASITVQQAWDAVTYSKDPDNSTASIYYIVFGANNEASAITAAENAAPASYESIPKKSASISDRLTETEWKVEVKYAYPQGGGGSGSGSSVDAQFNFDISSGTRKIVASIAQKSKYPESAPNSTGINDGEGMDIVTPVCTFSETHYYAPSQLTNAWKRQLAEMVGCINSSTFLGFNAGELLFSGCSGTRNGTRSDDDWQITFKFSFQANQTGIMVGELGPITKRGWDVLWIRYKEDPVSLSNNKKAVLRIPIAAYVEQVYKEANFSSLGL